MLKQLLIYVICFTLAIPFGLFVMVAGATSASAAAKKNPAPVEAPQKPPKDVRPPVLVKVEGQNPGTIYFQGQKIRWRLTFDEDIASVQMTAVNLDAQIAQKSFAGTGTGKVWQVETPVFTTGLVAGSHTLKILARDLAGNLLTSNFRITLKKIPQVEIVSYTVSKANSIVFNWKTTGTPDHIFVEWRTQDGTLVGQRTFDGKIVATTVARLEPGTSYTIKITPLYDDKEGIADELTFETLGQAPVKKVVVEQPVVATASVSTVTPAIDQGIATSKKVAPASPKVIGETAPKKEAVTSTPAITPSPTPTPENATKSGGWNKLLVALSILIIAAGAAIGGYYGYEWLMVKGKDKDNQPPESNDRW